jgi:phosphate starvation-inducible protein PhoH and related proteins
MTSKRTSKYRAKEEGGQRIVLLPKNDKQAAYIKALKACPQVIVTGPAGTGKTFIASTYAATLFAKGQIDKIILTRPNVASGRSLGFFPGTMEEKMAPWVIPFTDVLEACLGPEVYAIATKKRQIDIVPFEVMRGRTFNNAFVILDEAQNTSPSEMKMFLTRIGEESQVLLNGDIKQSDLRSTSGLKTIIDMIKHQNLPVEHIEFTVDDIVRSDICAMWVKAFDKVGI